MLQIEQAVLGSILLQPDSYHRISDKLLVSDFQVESNRIIWSQMENLIRDGKPVDLVTLPFENKVYLTELMECVPSAENIEHYANLCIANSKRSELRSKLSAISDRVEDFEEDVDDIITDAEAQILSIRRASDSGSIKKADQLAAEVYKLIEERADEKGTPTGHPTGILSLDQLVGGLSNTDLIIVAGRPAMGKSAFALGLADSIASNGHPTLVFSLEMSSPQLMIRLMSQKSGINAHTLSMGRLSTEEWTKLAKSSGELGEMPLYIDDSACLSLSKIGAISRRFKHEHKALGCVIVDYLQLVQPDKGGNREQEVAQMSRLGKLLAKELECPFILLSQLNRGCEMRDDKRPRLSDLRESGAIEQDADEVYFVYRECVYDEDADPFAAEIIVAKNRDGPIGRVECTFNAATTRFS